MSPVTGTKLYDVHPAQAAVSQYRRSSCSPGSQSCAGWHSNHFEEVSMHGLEGIAATNVETTVKSILARAEAAGITLTRDEVLEELKFREDEDTTIWGATVERVAAECGYFIAGRSTKAAA